jgi:AraC family transcriptional regulator of adaptative response / DNA-3-methyladenine glycosylase II
VPGIRVPGHVDGDEVAIRAVLGQQISVPAATRIASVLTERYGATVATGGPLHRVFPDAATLAKVEPDELPMPRARARTLVALAGALADGAIRLDAGADREQAADALGAIKGIGPWTVSYIRMRALGDPDAFLPGDLALRRALQRFGSAALDPDSVAEAWRPYRSYAMLHLWALDAASSDPTTPPTKGARP